jgi:hypothetical protein
MEFIIPNSEQLLSSVSSRLHESIDESLDDGALSLPESPDLVASRGVGEGGGVFEFLLDGEVIGQGDVTNDDIVVCPLVEQFHLRGLHGGVWEKEKEKELKKKWLRL